MQKPAVHQCLHTHAETSLLYTNVCVCVQKPAIYRCLCMHAEASLLYTGVCVRVHRQACCTWVSVYMCRGKPAVHWCLCTCAEVCCIPVLCTRAEASLLYTGVCVHVQRQACCTRVSVYTCRGKPALHRCLCTHAETSLLYTAVCVHVQRQACSTRVSVYMCRGKPAVSPSGRWSTDASFFILSPQQSFSGLLSHLCPGVHRSNEQT
jgi:hypothetical protein